MRKPLKLTGSNGQAVYINPDRIAWFEAWNQQTSIYFAGGGEKLILTVKEDPQTISKEIEAR